MLVYVMQAPSPSLYLRKSVVEFREILLYHVLYIRSLPLL